MNVDNDKGDDKMSVITQDKLKMFNEIYGYDHGPAIENDEEGEENDKVEELSNPNEGEDENKDEVHSLRSK